MIKEPIFIKSDFFHSKMKDCNVRRAKVLAIAFEDNDNIITCATNKVFRGHPTRFTIHAEEYLVQKLRKLRAIERFGKIHVLVMRWSIRKGLSNAQPCNKCHNKLINYGIRNIFFTDNKGKTEKWKS